MRLKKEVGTWEGGALRVQSRGGALEGQRGVELGKTSAVEDGRAWFGVCGSGFRFQGLDFRV